MNGLDVFLNHAAKRTKDAKGRNIRMADALVALSRASKTTHNRVKHVLPIVRKAAPKSLRIGVRRGRVAKVVSALRRGARPNIAMNDIDTQLNRYRPSHSIRTPVLVHATRQGDRTVRDILLKAGANKNIRNGRGRTALLFAARGGNVKAVNALLRRGAAVNLGNDRGMTPLAWAAFKGHQAVINRLLHASAYPNAPYAPIGAMVGATALVHAVMNGRLDVVDRLLKAGADPNIGRDSEGRPPLIIAAEWHDVDRTKIVKRLLEGGADVNCTDPGGWTPLMHAVSWDEPRDMWTLLKYGADVNVKTTSGWTVLMIMAFHPEVGTPYIRRILHATKDVNATDNEGKTALVHAVLARNIPMIRRLMEAGALPGRALNIELSNNNPDKTVLALLRRKQK